VLWCKKTFATKPIWVSNNAEFYAVIKISDAGFNKKKMHIKKGLGKTLKNGVRTKILKICIAFRSIILSLHPRI
jgi:hypothetical protein